ncbi:hypothetical protein FACS18949_13550 [Clostridia bacterium]|nr:hypothetical protein FACS189425_06280 [Clostridia bacterium]GHV35481.1 hypothetical protein FACS18949_13550 [Clostridia bacterium]
MADTARRVELQVKIDGVDISTSINPYLTSCSYTDNESDKTDDLQIDVDDREGIWSNEWFPTKGSLISVTAIQRNWNSDGKSRILDCGTFEIDTVKAKGFPRAASFSGTSLPYSSTLRIQKVNKAWENIKLSAIAGEIAKKHSLSLIYDSSYNPQYKRREQIQMSDIVFLQSLCGAAGISLKATSNTLVLFDASKYEQKPTICEIKYGASDLLSWNLDTKTSDVSYGRCHVIYTSPDTGKTIEYTYTPIDGDKSNDNQILEINEKVNTREEARQLAMKRLRQKNKAEFSAEFTLVGDVTLAAGATVKVTGYGVFDGKYIIETATHNFTGGYTVTVKLRKVLEGY